MAQSRKPESPRKDVRLPLNVRVDPELRDWLRNFAQEHGWEFTFTVEWALSFVRHMAYRLGDERMARLIDEKRKGGKGVAESLADRLVESYDRDARVYAPPELLPSHGKTSGKRRP